MSNIYVYSTTPNWKLTNDIKNTRLKDLEKEEIILYKVKISTWLCVGGFYFNGLIAIGNFLGNLSI